MLSCILPRVFKGAAVPHVHAVRFLGWQLRSEGPSSRAVRVSKDAQTYPPPSTLPINSLPLIPTGGRTGASGPRGWVGCSRVASGLTHRKLRTGVQWGCGPICGKKKRLQCRAVDPRARKITPDGAGAFIGLHKVTIPNTGPDLLPRPSCLPKTPGGNVEAGLVCVPIQL